MADHKTLKEISSSTRLLVLADRMAVRIGTTGPHSTGARNVLCMHRFGFLGHNKITSTSLNVIVSDARITLRAPVIGTSIVKDKLDNVLLGNISSVTITATV